MTDHLYEAIGGLPMPPDLTSGATTAVELDPARAVLTGLFKQAINSELGAAWTQVTDTLGSSHRLYGTSPVESTLELQPTAQELQQTKLGLPLLAVFRLGEATFEEHTLSLDRMTQRWGAAWIVGQATTAERRKLGDFLVAGAEVLRLAIERRGHPDYDGGALQFFATTGGLGSIRMVSANFEPQRINEQGETDWLILQAQLETVEYGRWDEGAYGSVTEMTADIGVGDSTGVIPSLVQVDSRHPDGDVTP